MAARKPTTKKPRPKSKPGKAPASPRRSPQRKQPAPPQRKGSAKAKAKPKSAPAKPATPRKRKPKAIGRPSKISQIVRVMVPEKNGKLRAHYITVAAAFVKVLATGCSFETAATTVGVSKVTAYDWISRGEEVRDMEPVPADAEPFLNFANDVARAREQVVTLALAGVLEAGKADWRAFAWFLERSRPQEFGRQTRIDHGAIGADGGRLSMAELMAAAVADPSTASDDDDPDLS
jgi:hypothetical protein